MITDQYSHNYFHWFNDALPRLIFLKHSSIKIPVLLDSRLHKLDFVKSSLQALDWPFYICERNNLLYVKRILIPDLTAREGSQHPIYFRILQEKLSNYIKGNHTSQKHKVFIKRRNSTHRNVLPEAKVENILKKYGFTTIETDEMSLEQQINLFKSCSHLVGAHGAGLTNMIFMGNGSKVLEIRFKMDDHNNCYFSMANTLGLEYNYFLSDRKFGLSNLHKDDFIVNILDFDRCISIFSLS